MPFLNEISKNCFWSTFWPDTHQNIFGALLFFFSEKKKCNQCVVKVHNKYVKIFVEKIGQ